MPGVSAAQNPEAAAVPKNTRPRPNAVQPESHLRQHIEQKSGPRKIALDNPLPTHADEVLNESIIEKTQ